MRYVEARIDEYNRDEAYRIYITEGLRLVPQNKYLTTSYSDFISPKKRDTRSGDEIVLDTFKNAGLVFGDGEQ